MMVNRDGVLTIKGERKFEVGTRFHITFTSAMSSSSVLYLILHVFMSGCAL